MAAVAIFGDPADPGSRIVPLIFGAFMLWAAWSWWHVGAVITRDRLTFRGMWGTMSIPRTAFVAVRSAHNHVATGRRLLLGASEARYEIVVDTQTGPQRLAGVGLTFASREAADLFVRRIDDALAALA
ncbi:hypothetical protein [Intrasporangium mesophilum]